MRRTAVTTSIILAALMLLASCATGKVQEKQAPAIVEAREFTDRQEAVAVSLPDTEVFILKEPAVIETAEIPAETLETPVPEMPEETAEEVFEEAVPVALAVTIIDEPAEVVVPEPEKEAPRPLGDMVYSVNLAGEESLIPQSLLAKDTRPAEQAEPVLIIPEEKAEEPVVDEIRPEDLVPYDVTVSTPEPWYRNVLTFLSAYGVWVAILFAVFAIVVILIVIVVKRPAPERGEREEEPRVVDEGPMEDETASQAASFDPEIERQRSMERIGEGSDDDYGPVQEFTGDDE